MLPNTLAAMVLFGSIALGATAVGSIGLVSSPTCQDEQGETIPCPGDTATPTPTPTPTPDPGSGNTEQPKPGRKPHEQPATMTLDVSRVERGNLVDWSACTADGFDLYAVVRSTDANVRWPLGRHDRLVAIVHQRDRTSVVDHRVRPGTAVWYRVFCLDRTRHGFKVLDSSPAVATEAPVG